MSIPERLGNLERRSYNTYQARLRSHQRLQRQNSIWNFSLISVSACVLIISILLPQIQDPRLNSAINTTLICVSAVSLVLTCVLLSLDFSARAVYMFNSYRTAQKISCEAEILRLSENLDDTELNALEKKFQIMLDSSENHKGIDWDKFLIDNGQNKVNSLEKSKMKYKIYRTLEIYPAVIIILTFLLAWGFRFLV